MTRPASKPPAADGPVMLAIPVPRELVTMVAAPPSMVSQRNALATVGLTPRVFLELLRRDDAPPVTRIGKVRLVEHEALVTWLRARATAGRARTSPANDSADAVLEELGLERVGGRR
jgi:hypothetical protein